MRGKNIYMASKIISGICNPFLIPFIGFLVLFLFSYLRMLPIQYKLIVLGVVYCFTILMPMITIYLFQKINGFGLKELSEREKRFVPYGLTILSYIFCLLIMYKLNLPYYMTGIILSALLILVFCILINLKWKICIHMAGMGAMVGGLLSLSFLFHYNPVWWLCVFILLSGFLGTSRIILRRHSLAQVLSGFAVGLLCTITGVLFLRIY